MTPLRRFWLAAAGIALCSTAYVAGRHAAYAQTQAEMNHESYLDYMKEDHKLNVVYQKLLSKYTEPEVMSTRKKIIASERAWISYRDAEAHMEASVGGEGGTIYPTLFNTTCEELTTERIKTLKDQITINDGR